MNNRCILTVLLALFCQFAVYAEQPMVIQDLIGKAKRNTDWKVPVATGEEGQVIVMSVSPQTNPDNEIGKEEHPFDQAILIVQGRGKATLNGTVQNVQEGDFIFVTEGTPHNIVNLSREGALKIISFYSGIDMPKDRVFAKKRDEQAYDTSSSRS